MFREICERMGIRLVDEKITYEDACKTIVSSYNKTSKRSILWSDIWNHPLCKKFPALYITEMYNAAIQDRLIGLILTDNTIAKVFYEIITKEDDVETN